MELFGIKLVELRKAKGLSQEELAADLKISQASISNYERGRKTIDTDTLEKICDYFNVPANYLLSDDKNVFHSVENHGENHGYMGCVASNDFAINKIIELFEFRLKEKDELNAYLKIELEKLKTEIQNLKEQLKK